MKWAKPSHLVLAFLAIFDFHNDVQRISMPGFRVFAVGIRLWNETLFRMVIL